MALSVTGGGKERLIGAMHFLARRLRAFGSVAERRNDLSFLMSLLEKPAGRVPSMAPEKWPSIQVESRVMRVMDDSTLEALVPEGGGGELGVTAASKPLSEGQLRLGGGGMAALGGASQPAVDRCSVLDDSTTLDDLLEQQFRPDRDPCAGIARIRSILGTVRGQASTESHLLGMNAPGKERYVAFIDQIHYGDMQSKTASMLLAKALGYDLDEPAEDPLFKMHPAGQGGAELLSHRSETAVDGGEASPGTARVGDEDGKGDNSSRAAFSPVSAVLVLSGADLHLVEFGQLQRLVALYGIVGTEGGSRSRLERSLCRHFNAIIKDCQVFERLSVLETPDRSVSAIRRKAGGGSSRHHSPAATTESPAATTESPAATTESPAATTESPASRSKREGEAGGGWSLEQDEQLRCKTEEVRDARKVIVDRVEEYLLRHGVPVQSTVEHDESISLWEVVADCFPGVTAKACKKRWMILHRLKCMESPADI